MRPYKAAELAFYRTMEICKQQAPEPWFKVVRGRSAAPETLAQLPDRSLDFVYIDAAHDYKNVRADILAWLPKLGPRGCIAGHDYSFTQARIKAYGVVRAVHEIFYCPDMVFLDSSWLVLAPNRKRCRTGRLAWDGHKVAKDQA
jgi:hypothetical protein